MLRHSGDDEASALRSIVHQFMNSTHSPPKTLTSFGAKSLPWTGRGPLLLAFVEGACPICCRTAATVAAMAAACAFSGLGGGAAPPLPLPPTPTVEGWAGGGGWLKAAPDALDACCSCCCAVVASLESSGSKFLFETRPCGSQASPLHWCHTSPDCGGADG